MPPRSSRSTQTLSAELVQLGNELLSLIEIEEARLLNWGFIQGSMDLDTQLPDLLSKLSPAGQELWHAVEETGISETELLDTLTKRQLVFRLEDDTFRSRFAETVRLLYLLRQRFSHQDWATAPKLVSDIKLELQRRTYPKREITLDELETRLQALSPTPMQLAVIRQLVRNTDGSSLLLARFQVEAIERQLLNLRQPRDKGMVIGAGTGAGKTKAFYIPAFAQIAEAMDPSSAFLQALAIYPRIELLKDQLAEAFAEARKLDTLLIEQGKRPITMGAFFGDAPESADWLERFTIWPRSDDGQGFRCTYFTCPTDANHTLIWEHADVAAEKAHNQRGRYGHHARLRCTTCSFQTLPGQLALTRQQMRQAPPDIVFTSTEMLNRRLSSPDDFALFGIGQANPPRLMLLDEIHTYEGITGAQTAYLLRRWRHARGQRSGHSLSINGLSATLSEATQFFTRLTGIPDYDIDYLAPQNDDLIEEGMEYNLVAKGDPVAGTSLLGTSIQTGMLVGRILDPMHHAPSYGAYGQRVFAFTDKLDVINRWYQSMYDAEFIKRLSQYRLPITEKMPPFELRNAQGQVWSISQRLGHDLSQSMSVSRTTSQDAGVSENSTLVIATSTLEVGYNDPRVGAVLQHKAPRSMASFLQRKGRAGRVRGMRPWTVVVTSAYGRDRWAFQHAEALFSPLLPPIDLPIENYYVRKIQAAYTLMDWAALQLKRVNHPSYVWQLLSTGTAREKSDYFNFFRGRLRDLLAGVLTGTHRSGFERYLQQALGMKAGDPAMHNILWGEPRPLYYEVIPTLVRQLETQWRKVTDHAEVAWGDYTAGYPMPDFVPPTLFGDLNLPEVQLELPVLVSLRQASEEPEIRTMSIGQALVEFAPGRASKRFVMQYKSDVAHWLALPDDAQLTRGVLNRDFLPIKVDEAPLTITHHGIDYLVYRPRIFTLSEVPKGIRSTAYAEMIWRTQVDIPTQHLATVTARAPLAPRSPWSAWLLSMRSFTQATGTWVDVTRFAIGVNTDTRYKTGEVSRRHLLFEDKTGDRNMGIGFHVAVDALQFTVAPMDVAALRSSPSWSELYQHFGPAFFRYCLHSDARLDEADVSPFAIDWLWQLELSMLTATATARGCTLAEAAKEVNLNRRAFADRTLRAIFQSQLSSQDQTVTDAGDVELVGRLHAQLLEYMDQDAVVASINSAAAALWDDRADGIDTWLVKSYTSSLGAVLLSTLTRLVPEIDPDDLALDIDGYTLWISETTAGGVGHISKLTDVITQFPRRFELQLDDVVQHCERAEVAGQLRQIAAILARGEANLHETFKTIRHTVDLASLVTVKTKLDKVLRYHGIPPTRSVVVGLNTKYLRPNSGPDSDALVVKLVDAWEQETARLGTAIDLRVMAVAARRIPAIAAQVDNLLTRIQPGQSADENQIFNLLQSMLWLGCHDSCPECIETWQPYQALEFPSRALIAALVTSQQVVVDFASPTMSAEARAALSTHFLVQIRCVAEQRPALKSALAHLLTTPLDIGYQTFYPSVERVEHQGEHWLVQLVIAELINA